MLFDFLETQKLLKKYKIPYCKTYFVKNEHDLKNLLKIKFPAYAKVSSTSIMHKKDIGGVVKIEESKAFLKVVPQLLKKKGVDGVLVQPELDGKEVIIGMKRDVTFGPLIIFGLGGIFVEILKDVSFGLAPLTNKDAMTMIYSIKGFPVLKGIRGDKPVNIKALAAIIVSISHLSLENDFVQEIDLNPIIVNEKKAFVVDAKIGVKEK